MVEKVARHVFIYRQKYVIKCIKTLYPENLADEMAHDLLKNCRIDPTTTSYKLGIDEIGSMCVFYEKQCQKNPGLFLYNHTKKVPLEELEKQEGALPPIFTSPVGMANEQVDRGMPLYSFKN